MSDPNPFVSNGICYLGPDSEADDLMFPCGNAALGHKACCQAGDMCLANRACFNGEFGVTYLSGCSDPSYGDESCPDKVVSDDQPWVGLVYCNGTSNQWVACAQANNAETIISADACACPTPTASRNIAFEDSSILENVVQLPTSSGGSVIWQPGHVPTGTTTTSTPEPTDGGGGGGGGGGGEGKGGGGLSVGTKAGIGVGVSVAGLLILGMVFLLLRKRRRWGLGKDNGEGEKVEPGDEQGTPPIELPIVPDTPSELGTKAARPWSMRSELDVVAASKKTSPLAGNGGSKLRPEEGEEDGVGGEARKEGRVAELPG
ncbi:uncharacterized protein DNG_09769 [Cephalotrichum gorgonifer]|uniref:Uncharacterized protein n=1 Tax=Cephalotrichum gorgonifer TaxID=2041049 RepID=A0AAE8N8U1_9PEZI|nr:uncharacterized protein DNG_09769 [Cephalotrichum gorgonifer]